jgi:glycosyltransferase involved in cell wall biosynthesis
VSRRVSILVTNYNYADYVGQAIESALAVRCGDKEIVVVDDGSTDRSREVIERYRDRIDRIIFTENQGQPAAANVAFAASTGDIVFFLDSDDMYLPQIAERVLAVWRDGVSKVQFPMLNADRDGVPNGTMFPNYASSIPPEEIRRSLIETGMYQWAPTTGNAWSREFLKHVFPVPEKLTKGFDSFMNPTAPLYGDVLTLMEPLVIYRIHGANSWAQADFDPERLLYYIEQDLLRTDVYLAGQAARIGVRLRPNPLTNNVSHLMYRLGAKRMLPGRYPIPHESVLRLLAYAGPAVLRDRGMGKLAKLFVLNWFLAVAVLPRPLAFHVMKLRFAAASRGEFFLKVMRAFGILREDARRKLAMPQG